MAAASTPRETAVALARQFASTPFADQHACCEAALSMSPCGLTPSQLKGLAFGVAFRGWGEVIRVDADGEVGL